MKALNTLLIAATVIVMMSCGEQNQNNQQFV